MKTVPGIRKETANDLQVLRNAGLLKSFYLAGGTGLALLLRHRDSYDLDFFSPRSFSENNLINGLRKAGSFSLGKKEEGTVRGKFKDTLVSFFHYPYSLIKKPLWRQGIRVASIMDIACMKIDAVASRGTKRDFIDLYFIIFGAGYSLADILRAFEKRYASLHYNMMHIKKSLVYFADAEKNPMPRMSAPLRWAEVKKFFINEVKNL